MALPSSGSISVGDIAAEFGGGGAHGLNEYFRGGANVVSSQTTTTAGGWVSPVTQSTAHTRYQNYFPISNSYPDRWIINGVSHDGVPNGPSYFYLGAYKYVRIAVTSLADYGWITVVYWNVKRYTWQAGTNITTNYNTGIPTTGEISLSDFYGGANP